LATLIVSDPIFLEHLVPAGHPERPERLRAIERVLAEEDFAALERRPAPDAVNEETIALAHDQRYIALIRDNVPAQGFTRLDADTTLSPKSYVAATRAVGAAVMAVDAVMAGNATNAFCASRPPGHHAEPSQAMGFCLFGNAVIAARHAQRAHGVARVAIVDFDVHHGNGTQACVWSDPTILYASTHQMPLYPGTGAASERGVGNVFNAPLPPGAGGVEFNQAYTSVILPAIESFAPELIIISAGFDAHWRDPLASLNLEEEDYASATRMLMDMADRHAGNRVVSLLEGGYDLQSLADSVAAHIKTLMSA
jgi:acetoin utilization deacetylase AcuC-like enzyme